MALCYKIKGKQSETITMSFAELKQLADYKGKDSMRFMQDLKKMCSKLNAINISCMNINGFILFNLFTAFIADNEEQTLTVEVNSYFTHLFNELYQEFTKFELVEYVSLQSKYSKNLYRLLKQYRATGRLIIKLNDLRDKLDCPETYSNKEFVRTCLNLAVKELEACFSDIQMTINRACNRGNPIESFTFTFTPQN